MLPSNEMEKLVSFYYIFNVPTQYQVIERLDGMRFIIHANENCGHNRGHVHIESGGAELEIDLCSFEVINCSGKINPHKIKVAQKFIEDNQQLFIEYWNEFSNGIKIDP